MSTEKPDWDGETSIAGRFEVDDFGVDVDSFDTVTTPMVFTIFPPAGDSCARHLRQAIKTRGGKVVPYEKRDEDPYTVTIINSLYFSKHPESDILLPNDAFAYEFVWDVYFQCENEVDFGAYAFTTSNYEKYDPNEILFRIVKWADLKPLANPPELKTFKETTKASISVPEPVSKETCKTTRKTVPPKKKPSQKAGEDGNDTSDGDEGFDGRGNSENESHEINLINSQKLAPPPNTKGIISPSTKDDKFTPRLAQLNKAVAVVFSSARGTTAKTRTTGKIVMDLQRVIAGPLRNEEGEILQVRKRKLNPSRTTTNTWIDPSAEAVVSAPGSSSQISSAVAAEVNSDIDLDPSSEDEGGQREHTVTNNRRGISRIIDSTPNKTFITVTEGQAILDLILERQWLGMVGGNVVWQHIADKQLLDLSVPRTWHSLRNHWIKTIVRDLESEKGPTRFQISSKNLKLFKQSVADRARQNSRGIKDVRF